MNQITPHNNSLNESVENVSRRRFIKTLGLGSGVLVLGVNLPLSTMAIAQDASAELALNFFVSLDALGTITIVCHRSEMGQGIRTSVPQIIADEMCANWNDVSVVQAPANREKYGSQGTAGSASIRSHFKTIRTIGATARYMLEQAAAKTWKVELSQVNANNGFVTNKATGKQLSFGQLAAIAAKIPSVDNSKIVLKSIDEFSLIGQDVKLTDLDDIVAGKAIYAQDIQLPNMLIASITRPPVVGATIKSLDDSAAKKISGVVDVITLKERPFPVTVNPLGGVAIVATNTWAALEARKLLKIEWDLGEKSTHDSEQFKQTLKTAVQTSGKVVRERGNVKDHQYVKDKTLEATYSVPYLHHASMETPAATAIVEGDKCTIWAGTQNPQWAQNMVAAELKLPPEKVNNVVLNVTLMGGAFGRKSKGDFVVEAVELSVATKRPVKVIWTREDDVKNGFYHSVSANYHKAQLDENNHADFWVSRNAYPPIGWLFNDNTKTPSDNQLSLGFADLPFNIDNLSCENHEVDSFLRPGWLRSVACINNGFALGSFVDELADKANITPRQMWLNLLGKDNFIDPREDGFEKWTNYGMVKEKDHRISTKRIKDLINLLSDKANIEQKLPKNEGWGLSFLRSFGSYVAAATKVRVENDKVTVLEMHTAVDCGIVITPDRVKAQMEGAMIMGLTIALMGEITAKDGAVVQSNFHDYPVARMQQIPPLHVHLVESKLAPGGIGLPSHQASLTPYLEPAANVFETYR
jgi:isoquinoline 1-oxidoreductase beta subunit